MVRLRKGKEGRKEEKVTEKKRVKADEAAPQDDAVERPKKESRKELNIDKMLKKESRKSMEWEACPIPFVSTRVYIRLQSCSLANFSHSERPCQVL